MSGALIYREGEQFPGVIGRTVPESVPAWMQRNRPPQDAPNVVVVLFDDVGFAELGCFGSGVQTPTCDRLAAGGVRYREFHTASICVPSRACLLTGRNPHANGKGGAVSGFPGYTDLIPRQNGLLSEMLRAQGYATFALGKWHLAPQDEMAAGSPRRGWPLSRGFDRYYGHLTGQTDQFTPELVYDSHPIPPPARSDQGYHLSADLADRAIQFIAELRAVSPEQPFFMYYCPSAGHAPHQVPSEWAEMYRGTFDKGWDRYREEVFDRQRELGVVPPSTNLTGRPSEIPAWEEIGAEERKVLARQMEIYAGFISHADHHVGRIVDYLADSGELDNTLLLVASDNGASHQGGRYGGNVGHQRGMSPSDIIEMNLRMLDKWGGPETQGHYAAGWAWAGNCPLRRWKGNLHEGGISDPLIVHWPVGIEAQGEIRDAFVYITDIAPTVLDVVNTEPPGEIEGIRQAPIDGVSFAHTFDNPNAKTKKVVQYYEGSGARGIWRDGWKAVAEQDAAILIAPEDLRNQHWELYHVAEDFSESRDLADAHPEKLREMIDLWWVEAGKYGVLPLDARANSRWSTKLYYGRSERGEPARTKFIYRSGMGEIPAKHAPDVYCSPHEIVVDLDTGVEKVEGVLVAQGDGHLGGYSFHVKDGYLCYTYNWMGLHEYRCVSHEPLPTGRIIVGYRFDPVGDSGGVGIVSVNNREFGRIVIPKLMPSIGDVRTFNSARRGLFCGYFGAHPLTDEYDPPYRCTGDVVRVVVEVGEAGSRASDDAG